SVARASASADEVAAAVLVVWVVAAAIMPRLACAAMSMTRTIRIPTRLQTTSRNESWPGASIWLSALRFATIRHRSVSCSLLFDLVGKAHATSARYLFRFHSGPAAN